MTTAQELIDTERKAGQAMQAKRSGRDEHFPGLIAGRRAEAQQEPWPAIRETCYKPFVEGDEIIWCAATRTAYSPNGWALETIQRAYENAGPSAWPADMADDEHEYITAERSAELRTELRAMYIETWRGQQPTR